VEGGGKEKTSFRGKDVNVRRLRSVRKQVVMCGKRICEVADMQRLRSVRKEDVDM